MKDKCEEAHPKKTLGGKTDPHLIRIEHWLRVFLKRYDAPVTLLGVHWVQPLPEAGPNLKILLEGPTASYTSAINAAAKSLTIGGKHIGESGSEKPEFFFHGTSLAALLSLLASGRMISSQTPVAGVYSTSKPSACKFYEAGAVLTLRAITFLAGLSAAEVIKAQVGRVVPEGVTVQFKKSQHEFVHRPLSVELCAALVDFVCFAKAIHMAAFGKASPVLRDEPTTGLSSSSTAPATTAKATSPAQTTPALVAAATTVAGKAAHTADSAATQSPKQPVVWRKYAILLPD